MSEQDKIIIYVMRASENGSYRGYLCKIDNTLQAMQEIVQGDIEVVSLDENILIVLNEEGKLIGLPSNRVWLDETGNNPLDVLMGNIFCCRSEGEEFTSLHPEDIPVIQRKLIGLKGNKFCTEDNLPIAPSSR